MEVLKNDRSKIDKIIASTLVADFGLSDGEILVIQILGTSRISTAPEVFSDNLVDKSIPDCPVTITDGELSEDQKWQGELKE